VNANKFFTQYPKAVEELKIKVEDKPLPEFFKSAYDFVMSEKNESTNAKQISKETKKTVRSLSSSLIKTARALENGINSVLHLQNSKQEPIDFESQGDIITRLQNFSVALTNYENVLKENSAYKAAVDKFNKDFAVFKTAAGKIGATKSASKREQDELDGIIEKL
jgi:hypothetical protein